MIKYRYDLMSANDCFFWVLLEEETQRIVWAYIFEEDAADAMRHGTNGGGFDGFTPEFFTVAIPGLRAQ